MTMNHKMAVTQNNLKMPVGHNDSTSFFCLNKELVLHFLSLT